MDNRLSILLIEANPGDERLIRELLADFTEPSIEVTSCATLDSGLAFMATRKTDLVLSDLTLPDSAGLDTLAAILKRSSGIPIIVLTGADDREMAEKAIHMGAQDYLQKAELVAGILQRAIVYALERQRVQEALRKSERRFRMVFEESPLAISIVEPDGKGVLSANRAFFSMLGYEEEDLPQLTLEKLTHPDDLETERKGVSAVSHGERSSFVREKRLLRKDGTVLWAKTIGTILQEADGIPEKVLVIQQDITLEKEAARELDTERKRLRSVMEAMPAFVYLQDQDFTISFANKQFTEYFGDPAGKHCYAVFRGRSVPCSPCPTLGVLESQEELIREWTDDQGRVFEIRECPIEMADGHEHVLVIGVETTEVVAATKELRASEQRFRELAEMLPEVVFECDLEGHLTFANRAGLEHFGYTKREVSEGLNAFDMLVDEDLDRIHESVERLLAGGEEHSSRYTAKRRDGSTFPATIHSSVVRQDGQPVGLRGIIVNVTDQIEIQHALEESESRLRAVLDTVPDLLFQLDAEDRICMYHAPAEQLYVSPDKFLGTRIGSTLPEESSARMIKALQTLKETGEMQMVEYSLQICGEIRDYEARLIRGDIGRTLIMIRDISARKQALKALEAADDILRHTPIGMFVFRYEEPDRLVLVDANPEAERLTGMRLPEWSGRELNEIWPDARAAGLTDAYLNAFTNSVLFNSEDLESGALTPSAPFHIRAFRIPDERLVVSFEDISEQEEAKRKLQESEQRNRAIVETSPVGILTVTSKGRIASANRAFLAMTGYQADEMIGLHFTKLPAVHARDLPQYIRTFRSLVTGRIPEPFESSWTTKDGQTRHGEVQVALMKGAKRDWSAQIIVQDVTERHEAQEALRRSEANYRSLFENAVLGIYRTTPDGRILAANNALVRMLGYETFEQLAERNLEQEGYAARSTRSTFKEQLEKTGRIDGAESSWIRKDGTEIIIREHANLVRDDQGEILYYEGTMEDITEQRIAERQLDEFEATQQGILHASPIGIGLIRDGRFQWVSDRICEMCGYSSEELVGQSPALISSDPTEFQRIQHGMDEEMIQLGVADTETQWRCKDGSLIDVNLRFAMLDPKKPERGGIFTLLDITERKRMEQSLHLTQYSIDSTDVIILWLRPTGKVVFANNAACRLLGYSRSELLEKSAWDITADYPLECRDELWHALKQRGAETSETLILRKDGTAFPAELTAQFLDFQGTEYEFVFAVDISERKAAEAALHESEENYRTIFNSASDAIMVHDASTGQLLDANERAVDMYGYSVRGILALPVCALSADEPEYSQEEVLKNIHAAAAGEPQVFEWRAKKRSGELFWVEVSLRSVTLVGNNVVLAIVRDISERKALEGQLRQSQKLESIGTLASGVAHEINNPLMGMINYAELISSRVEDSSLKEFAEGIKSEGDRVAKIVRNLLSFSRQDQEQHSRARMTDIVAASLSLIGSLLRKDFIQLGVHVPDDLPFVRCRSQQMQQVLINLVTNARDSLNTKYPAANTNKSIHITSHVLRDEDRVWLRTTVEDSGEGISKELIARIFDPFFTTKARNEGTGLGLSITYGIVREHGGRLDVESEPGQFSRFHVDLPLDVGDFPDSHLDTTNPHPSSSSALADDRMNQFPDAAHKENHER